MADQKDSADVENQKGINRRDFLKILGVTGGVAATACARQPVEKIIPYVNQPDEIIPGVAAWYAGTCGECSSGCGILVRTREGRAVKVEGNPQHPKNRGGLCARGQSSLQALYDPDRIREPLMRSVNGAFKNASWEDALTKVSEGVANVPAGKKVVLLTGPQSGSTAAIISELKSKLPSLEHVEFSLFNTDALDAGAEIVFGSNVKTRFDFSKAEVIASFGAGFLESWLSPVEFSKQWAQTRKADGKTPVSHFVHVEPRLSLTAANADKWIKNAPGSEVSLLKALLALVAKGGVSNKLSASSKQQITRVASNVDVDAVCKAAGVEKAALSALAKRLLKARNSIVVAGGASVSGEEATEGAVLANLINAALGNIGSTVLLTSSSKAGQSLKDMSDLVAAMNKEESDVAALIIHGVNPLFALPTSSDFGKALSKAPLVVSLSAHMDETTSQANVVLPASTSFEAWSDSEPLPGVFGLNQPAMQPLYETLGLGDFIIALGNKLKIKFADANSFYDYIRNQWQSRVGATGFESRWTQFVQDGGDLNAAVASTTREVSADAVKFVANSKSEARSGLNLLAFPTVHSEDGSTANRAWLQELPDPLTTSVWGSWVEMHPQRASSSGLKHGDIVQVRTDNGSLSAPLYITKNIHPNLVAVPIGQGHKGYGRYAAGVGANPLSILDAPSDSRALAFVAGNIKVFKDAAREELLLTQGSDDQLGRGIARWVKSDDLSHHLGLSHGGHDSHGGDSHGGHDKKDDHGHSGGHGHSAKKKNMYEQMVHPKYKWGMSVDLSNCTGCSACVVACYAENNVPVVGRKLVGEGREMSWIRISRYLSEDSQTRPVDGFIPMMCQHCSNAPCEPVCPVYATYHNEEGLNTMVYNRCVGTRYCSNNCSYKVRRFNWFKYQWPDSLAWQLNPDVTVREVGVMEKCTFCVQRIRDGQNKAKNLGRPVQDGEIEPACASSCPTDAIQFGNLLDHKSEVYKKSQDVRAYKVLDAHLNTQPAISYLARVVNDDQHAKG